MLYCLLFSRFVNVSSFNGFAINSTADYQKAKRLFAYIVLKHTQWSIYILLLHCEAGSMSASAPVSCLQLTRQIIPSAWYPHAYINWNYYPMLLYIGVWPEVNDQWSRLQGEARHHCQPPLQGSCSQNGRPHIAKPNRNKIREK